MMEGNRMRVRIALFTAALFLAANAGAAEVASPPAAGGPPAPVPAPMFPPAAPPPPPPAFAPTPPNHPPPVTAPSATPAPGISPAPPVSPPPPAIAPPRSTAAPSAGFLVKFNNADVYEVIHTLGRIAGINYLIDPRVKGVVNVHTQGTVRKEDALELLLSILRVNGATAVKEGEVYHVVPMVEAKMEPLAVGRKEDGDSPNRPTMRAFPLQYIAASEMAKVIRPFVSTGGDATEIPRANMLLVTDTAANMEKHARLVELFDADAFKTAGVRIFPLKFLDPDEMGKNLDSIFGALDFGAKGGRPSGINFVPLPRMNALLVVSASSRTMEDVARWVNELDKEPSSTSRQVHLYRVRHGKVKDVSAILEKLFPGKTSGVAAKTEFKPQVAETMGRSRSSQAQVPPASGGAEPPAPSRADSKSAAAAPRAKEGEGFDIIADEPTNSIIIRGSASEYSQILDTLNVIDVYPKQVLLEVLIGEVQLDDALRLGIDWSFKNITADKGKITQNISLETSAASITSGLQYLVDKTDRFSAAFRALANDGKVSILSSPSVISTNGKKSKIDVSNSVPVVSATITATNPTVVTETVEYRDVGVILNFTPYINDEGIVTLEIEQEVSEVAASSSTGGTTNNPTFFKRSISTTLIASQDQSIVLGGLVRETNSRTRDGLPFLYKIPFVGWLFGARSASLNRNELLIFITPRVIASVDDGTRLSREFQNRVLELKEHIGRTKGVRTEVSEPPPAPAR